MRDALIEKNRANHPEKGDDADAGECGQTEADDEIIGEQGEEEPAEADPDVD